MKSEIKHLNPKYFMLRYNNPSPGNPIIKSLDFDNSYIYAIWTNGEETKTPVKRTEDKYVNGEFDGVTIWLTDEINIFLEKIDEEFDEEFDEEEGF